MKNQIALALGIALTLGVANSAHAITFTVPGLGSINDVQTFDWAPGNAIAIGAVGAGVDDTFQLLAHGFLSNFLDSDGQVINNNLDLNTDYQLTFVTSFEEVVTTSTGFPGVQAFETTGVGTNFFEIWAENDSSQFADMLAGTGFNTGVLIASGEIQAGGVGSFTTAFNAPGGVPLDAFGDNDYPDINSVGPGAGGTIFNVVVDFGFYNTDYFVNGVGPMTLSFNTSQALPFQETNPSALFVDTAGGAAPTQEGATLDSVGAINGISGPNVMFQADANSGVRLQQVPEPASLALIGLGLAALGLAVRRRTQV